MKKASGRQGGFETRPYPTPFAPSSPVFLNNPVVGPSCPFRHRLADWLKIQEKFYF
jgi:hypothetical protein